MHSGSGCRQMDHPIISGHLARMLPAVLEAIEAEWRRLSPSADAAVRQHLIAAHEALGVIYDAYLRSGGRCPTD